jgi:hypothetical protein
MVFVTLLKMYKSSKFICLTTVVVMLTAIACTKTEAGPKGDKGDPGPTGATGSAASTVVNITVPSGSWVIDTSGLKSKWLYTIYTTEITKDIYDKGSVKVLMQKNAQWYELPYFEGDVVMQYGFLEKLVMLENSNIHASLPQRPVTMSFRIVIVPGH